MQMNANSKEKGIVIAVRTAARHILLAAKRRGAVAAIAGDHLDPRFVDELHAAPSLS
jgi:hypothetical protein